VIGPESGPSPRPSRPPAPELIGSVLAVIVAAVIVGTALASRATPPGPEPSGSGQAVPSSSAIESVVAVTASPPVDPKTVELLRQLNQDLAQYGDTLKNELGRASFRIDVVKQTIVQLNIAAQYGVGAVPSLGGALLPDEVGGQLIAKYLAISSAALKTLDASVSNEAAYKIGANTLVKLIDGLAPLQTALDALAVSTPSPPPSPSASASPSVVPSPSRPSPSPPPSVAPPSSGAPSSGPSGSASASPIAEQIVNGGFEAGVGPPWQLLARTGISATLTQDTVAPPAGAASARVDITSPSIAYSAISLQQGDLHIEAGRYYTLSLMVRSAGTRDIRIGIMSTGGEAPYYSREVGATPAWTPISFTFAASATDLDAVLALDLGRSDVSTWFDAVSFSTTPVGP
jgi:hypothetical protein